MLKSFLHVSDGSTEGGTPFALAQYEQSLTELSSHSITVGELMNEMVLASKHGLFVVVGNALPSSHIYSGLVGALRSGAVQLIYRNSEPSAFAFSRAAWVMMDYFRPLGSLSEVAKDSVARAVKSRCFSCMEIGEGGLTGNAIRL